MRNFTTGSIRRQLIAFSVPIVLADLLQSLYNVIDAFWVGRILGYEALAAVSVSTPLIFFMAAILMGLATATNTLIGQSFGANNRAYLKRALVNSFCLIMALCAVISLASLAGINTLLALINTPSVILKDARSYLGILLGGLIITAAYNWLFIVLRAMGDSKTPLVIAAGSLFLNALLDPLLIMGMGPFPRLGIAGSAIATVIATAAAALAGYVFIRRKYLSGKKTSVPIAIDWSIIRKLFRIGMPVTAHLSIVSTSSIVIMGLVNTFGPVVTAAAGIGVRFDMFAILPALSMGIAVSSMSAQNLGAGRFDRISSIVRWGLVVSVSFAVFFFVLVNLYAPMIAFQGVIRGSGDTLYLFGISIVSILLIRIPLAFFLSRYTALAEAGIWIAIPLSAAVGLALNIAYFLYGRWRRLTAVHEPALAEPPAPMA